MCKNWPDVPIAVGGATGGLIGDTVMTCGGSDGSYVDVCYSLSSQQVTSITHMSVGRSFAASIVLNENTLWVTGGLGDSGLLESTEKITITGTILGPNMPLALSSHAIVAINSTCSMVIAGYDGSSFNDLTFYHDNIEGEWINGPSLLQFRYSHAAGIVTDEVTNENFVAVTGGYIPYIDGYMTSTTELLQDEEWVQGKKKYFHMHYFLEIFWLYQIYVAPSFLKNHKIFFSFFRTIASYNTSSSFYGEIRQRTSNTWRQDYSYRLSFQDILNGLFKQELPHLNTKQGALSSKRIFCGNFYSRHNHRMHNRW